MPLALVRIDCIAIDCIVFCQSRSLVDGWEPRMVGTAAHLTDHVFFRLPLRQWVLSIPKRLRCLMQRDGAVLNMVLRNFQQVIAQSLQSNSPGAAQAEKATLQGGGLQRNARPCRAGAATAHPPTSLLRSSGTEFATQGRRGGHDCGSACPSDSCAFPVGSADRLHHA